MLFKQLSPHFCRTYLIGNAETRSVVLIDPVIDHFSDYLALLKENGYKLTHVIDTHTQADHISAGTALTDATECDYVMYETAPSKCVTIRVKDGDELDLNGVIFKVLHTPGHASDAICLIAEDKLFTGDTLFLDDGGAGRDDLPGGNPADHWDSLQRLYTLPDNLVVYPSHDYNNREPSSLGRQREANPHFRFKNKEEFVTYLDELRLGPADWMRDVVQANYACATDPNAAWIPIDAPACQIQGTLDKNINEIEVDTISAENLKELLSRDDEKPILLDVREDYELTSQLGALDGIINMPIGSLTPRLGELEAYKDKTIVVICRSGHRATTGAQILKKAGFRNAMVLDGGMINLRYLESKSSS